MLLQNLFLNQVDQHFVESGPSLVGALEDVDRAGRHDVAEVVEFGYRGETAEVAPPHVAGQPVVPALLDHLWKTEGIVSGRAKKVWKLLPNESGIRLRCHTRTYLRHQIQAHSAGRVHEHFVGHVSDDVDVLGLRVALDHAADDVVDHVALVEAERLVERLAEVLHFDL